MKRFLSLTLVLTLLLTCVACGKSEPVNTDSSTTTESATESTTENTTVDDTTTENSLEEGTTANEENTTKTEKEDTTKENGTTTTTKPKETTTKKTETTTKKSSVNTTTTTTKPTTTTPTVSVVTNNDIAKIKNGFLRLVNEERARKGVQTLSTNSVLTTAANTRSRELLTTFSHTRPNGQPYYSVLNPNQYTPYGTGENIQYTSHMGNKPFTKDDLFVGREDQIVAAYTTIFNNFKNSAGHYENMINEDYIETGIGISCRIDESTGMAIFYICQIFGCGSDY